MRPASEGPDRVVIVGAAGGMGRFLATHLFDGLRPLVLVDIDPAVEALAADLRDAEAVVGDWLVEAPTLPARTLVVSALRFDRNDGLFRALGRTSAAELCVCDVASSKVPVLDMAATRLGRHSYFGLHPLFGPTVRGITGQTVVACPGFGALEAPWREWLIGALAERGGFGRTLPAPEHDFVMAYLQTASHQALLAFADVLSRGPFTPEYLWQMRTPLFEMLLSLVGRVLSPSQQSTIASIELSTYGLELVSEYQGSFKSLSSTLLSNNHATVEEYIERVRDPFSSAGIEALERTAALAVASVQDVRFALAEARRLGTLVALRHVESGRIHAGEVVELSSVDVVLDDYIVPVGDQLALLVPGARDGRRQRGLQAPRARTRLNLANTQTLGPDEFERILDERSVACRLSVSLLWPWAAVDRAALAAVERIPGVLGVRVAHERVWAGRRELIVDVDHRIDCDPARVRADVLAVADIGRLDAPVAGGLVGGPKGKVRPGDPELVVYHAGPAGSPTETAAQRVASGRPARLDALADVEAALDAALASPGTVAVVPLLDGRAGLVEPSAAALAARRGRLRSAGLVDVPTAGRAGHEVVRCIAVTAGDGGPGAERGPVLWVLPLDELRRDGGALLAAPGLRVELLTGASHAVAVVDGETLPFDQRTSLGTTAWQWIRPV